ncbi:MAG: SGNH/GDSL hydrolase family protein [Chitinophagaceae bacterium]|nr:SGNH/GDSL hydrolase family protein [Chitinophagaceae bacterium]MCW5928787.1 SGNH/GDSL hydrolase family protein [Chitinophagaceae bacterium]
MKQFSLLFCLCFVLAGAARAQQTTYKWWNPATSPIRVIEGQGWYGNTEAPYDRFPANAKSKVRPEVWELGKHSAGLYIRFTTNSREITVRYKVTDAFSFPHMPSTGVSGIDLYAKDRNKKWHWSSAGRYTFGDTVTYRFEYLEKPQDTEEFRLYLPLYNQPQWLEIGVPAGNSFAFLPVKTKKPVIIYGSSIAQGACATRPGLGWTNILNRMIDRPVINLGFSGNGTLDEAVMDLINALDPSVIVLDCLPNLVDTTLFPYDDLKRRIAMSLQKCRAKHPDIPVLLIEHAGGLPGSDLDANRRNRYNNVNIAFRKIVGSMSKKDLQNVYILRAEDIGLHIESTVDGSHPNDLGMMQYAEACGKVLQKILQ